MNRCGLMAPIAPALAFLVLAASGTSHAQEADVKAALAAYHGAFEARDLSKMTPLWAHGADVMLVGQNNESISVGWDAVQKNWQAQFSALSEVKIRPMDGPHIQVKGDTAWSMGVVNATLKYKSGAESCYPIFETDVFEKSGAGWLLVSHIGSTVPPLDD